MWAAARHPGGFPSPTPSLRAQSKAQPPHGPGKVPAPCGTQHLHLPRWPSTDPRKQGPSARPFPHPQSHGPGPAHPHRPASLFHFCKLGVGATDRMKGCGALHLRFRKFLAPPSSIGEKWGWGVFLSSPHLSRPERPERSKDRCGEGLLRTHTQTHTSPPPKSQPQAASGGSASGRGRESRCPRMRVRRSLGEVAGRGT